MELSPSWKAISCATTQNFETFYETRFFVTMFTRTIHRSLAWARSIQFVPFYPISLRSLIIQIRLGDEYKLRSSSLCGFLHPPVTSSLLGPNILLSTLSSYTLSLSSSLNDRDNVRRPYSITGKIIYLQKTKVLNGNKHYQNSIFC
jgi:hypothetical protein